MPGAAAGGTLPRHMPRANRLRSLTLGVGGLVLLVALGGWGGHAPRARDARSAAIATTVSLKTFAGFWGGHTRGLTITSRGQAYEQLGDGCCDEVVHMHLRLSDPRGTPGNATALARITSIQLLNAKDYRGDPAYHIPASPQPYVGKTARLRLRNGVITEPLDGFNATYCNARTQAKGVCGA